MNSYDGLAGWGKILDKVRKPIKKVVGKNVYNETSKAAGKYGLTVAAGALTVATGGAAAPVLVAAVADAAAKEYAHQQAKKAQGAADAAQRDIDAAITETIALDATVPTVSTAPRSVSERPYLIAAGIGIIVFGALLLSTRRGRR